MSAARSSAERAAYAGAAASVLFAMAASALVGACRRPEGMRTLAAVDGGPTDAATMLGTFVPHDAATLDGAAATTTDCASCHMPEFRAAEHPVHVGLRPTTCADCHAQEQWKPTVVHHDFWPLTGDHAKGHCAYCHEGKPPVYKGTSRECVGCHREDFDVAATTSPGHSAYGTACAPCHTTSAWKPATGGTPDIAPPAQDPPDVPELSATDAGGGTGAPTPPKKPKPKPKPEPVKPPDVVTHASHHAR